MNRSGQLALYKQRSNPNQVAVLGENSMVRMEMLPKNLKKTLLEDIKKLHSFTVCGVVKDMFEYTTTLKTDHKTMLEAFKTLEQTKETILEESRTEMTHLMGQKEKLMDEKRELEYELIMKDSQEERA